MIVFEQNIVISNEQNNQHLYYEFNLEKMAKKLTIDFSYNPKIVDLNEQLAKTMLKATMNKFYSIHPYNDDNISMFLPLTNHITLSLDSPNGWIGTAHRGNNISHIELTNENADRGFNLTNLIPGIWGFSLSVNCLISKQCTCFVKIEVEYE